MTQLRYQILTEYSGNFLVSNPATLSYIHQSTFEGQTVDTSWSEAGLVKTLHVRGSSPILHPVNGMMRPANTNTISNRVEYKIHFDRPIILKSLFIGDFDSEGGGERFGGHVPPLINNANTNVGKLITGIEAPSAVERYGIRRPFAASVGNDAGGALTWGGPGWAFRPSSGMSGPIPELSEKARTGQTLNFMYGHPPSIGSGHSHIVFDVPEYRTAYWDCSVWRDTVTHEELSSPNFVGERVAA